jgi:hypothetical protein
MTRIGFCGAVLFLWIMTGCAGTIGANLAPENVHAVTPGRTTKTELFALLRASPNAAGPDDPSYTLFPQAGESDRVHFFESSRSYSYPVPLFVYWGAHYVTKTDRLWVLIDEKTGVVEDYAFKKFGQPVEYGRPRLTKPRGETP